MSNNKQSSVEWLINEHFGGIENCTPDFRMKIEQAKAMHKEEIIAAKDDNYVYGEAWEKLGTLGEQYYNETYGKAN